MVGGFERKFEALCCNTSHYFIVTDIVIVPALSARDLLGYFICLRSLYILHMTHHQVKFILFEFLNHCTWSDIGLESVKTWNWQRIILNFTDLNTWQTTRTNFSLIFSSLPLLVSKDTVVLPCLWVHASLPPNDFWVRWWIYCKLGMNIMSLEVIPSLHFVFSTISNTNMVPVQSYEFWTTVTSLCLTKHHAIKTYWGVEV